QVSVDGDKVTHDFIRGDGSYEKAVQALNILRENNIPHSISFTINKQNVHYSIAIFMIDPQGNPRCTYPP
ncbi:MAG: hypothetical protein PHF64_06775, partial [Methanoregula sp.]|nr:hypothetical protein [Methanoregula sp.]